MRDRLSLTALAAMLVLASPAMADIDAIDPEQAPLVASTPEVTTIAEPGNTPEPAGGSVQPQLWTENEDGRSAVSEQQPADPELTSCSEITIVAVPEVPDAGAVVLAELQRETAAALAPGQSDPNAPDATSPTADLGGDP